MNPSRFAFRLWEHKPAGWCLLGVMEMTVMAAAVAVAGKRAWRHARR